MSSATVNSNDKLTENLEYDVFMSYHPDILKQVENIHEKLIQRYKYRIWPEVFDSNEQSTNDLIKIIKNATIFLCFVTQAYCQSARCLKQVELADKTHGILIFAIVENVEEKNLGDLEVFLKKAKRKNVLKCYDSESDWWTDRFEHLKELIFEGIKNLQETYRERYTVVRDLGEGAEGFIYKVKDLLERKEKFKFKALKEFKQIDSQTNAALVDLLNDQMEVLQSEKHKNIIRYIDFFTIISRNKEFHYLLTEFYNEGSLEELINEKNQYKTVIEPDLQKKWSLQMLNGLEFLHNRLKVIHRDIKPGNIFFNDKMNIVIGDFGHSKLNAQHEFSFRRSLRQFGTISYLAPELIEDGKFTSKIDIWALGCVVYEMVTLEKLFPCEANKDFAVKQNILDFEIDNIARQSKFVNSEPVIKKLIKRSLISDDYRRFTAQELIKLLEDENEQTIETDEPIVDQYCLTRERLTELKPGFKTVTGIDLSYKGLRSITVDAFGDLNNLTVLDFSENQLESIEENAFNGIPNLKVLRLERNRFTFIKSETFSKLTNLENLRLDNNQLQSIDEKIFSNLTNLTELGLRSNKLEFINPDAFRKLNNLTDLDLSNNQIESFDARSFSNLKCLTSLKLNNNRLQDLDQDLFSSLENLLFLWLRNNKIRTLPKDIFKRLQKIEKIRLSGNKIPRGENLKEHCIKPGVIILDE